jgi:hypothetical protein
LSLFKLNDSAEKFLESVARIYIGCGIFSAISVIFAAISGFKPWPHDLVVGYFENWQ